MGQSGQNYGANAPKTMGQICKGQVIHNPNQETAQSLRDRLRGKSVCMDHKKSLHLPSSPLRCIIGESPNRRAVLRYQLNLHRHRSVIPLENHQISAKFDQNYLHSAKCQMSGNIPCLWNGVPGQHLQVVDGEDRSALWTIPEPGYIITIVIILNLISPSNSLLSSGYMEHTVHLEIIIIIHHKPSSSS